MSMQWTLHYDLAPLSCSSEFPVMIKTRVGRGRRAITGMEATGFSAAIFRRKRAIFLSGRRLGSQSRQSMWLMKWRYRHSQRICTATIMQVGSEDEPGAEEGSIGWR